MKSINNYIIEKFKINKNTQIKKRNVSHVNYDEINKIIYFDGASDERDRFSMIQTYHNKKIDPQKIIDDIQSIHILMVYWWICIVLDFDDYYPIFKNAILDQTVFTEDELDAYILSRYKHYKGFTEMEKAFEKYLDMYNIEYNNEK